MTPTQIYGKMTAANMYYKVSRRLIFKWHERFQDGRESLEDDIFHLGLKSKTVKQYSIENIL